MICVHQNLKTSYLQMSVILTVMKYKYNFRYGIAFYTVIPFSEAFDKGTLYRFVANMFFCLFWYQEA